MSNQKKVWVSTEELNETEAFVQSAQELTEQSLVDTMASDEATGLKANRRDFLKYAGFGIGLTVMASCEIPIKKAIPYVVKPDSVIPGVANYYASSFVDGGDFVPILVKTREGRPIKIEGNSNSSFAKGGTNARVQASVLDLYDTNRLEGPGKVVVKKISGKDTADVDYIGLDKLDADIQKALNAGSKIRIVTRTNISRIDKVAIEAFKAKYPNTKVVTYDPISVSGLLDANKKTFGKRVVPAYHFDKADVIVSFDADFLGTWISPTEYTRAYSEKRKVRDTKNAGKYMSRHIQFEDRMSLTGSNADNRVLVRPSEMAMAVALLYNEIAGKTGEASISGFSGNFKWAKAKKAIANTAKELLAAKGKSLVVSGVNDVNIQLIVNKINQMLNNYGSTLDIETYSNQRQGSDKAIHDLLGEMGSVDAVFVLNANPVYDLPKGEAFGAALSKVGLTVSMNATFDETAHVCKYVAPVNHFLESWGDAEPQSGHLALIQPTIYPIFKTREFGLHLLNWAGAPVAKSGDQPYYEFLKNNWKTDVFPNQNKFATFQAFWDNAVHDGGVHVTASPIAVAASGDLTVEIPSVEEANTVVDVTSLKLNQPSSADFEVSLYESVGIGAGQYANNPWLQEMPDPMLKTVWDNFVTIPVNWNDSATKFEGLKNLKDGDKVKVTVNGVDYVLPVVRQFGQHPNTVSIALGYGRTKGGKAGTGVGVNLYPAVGENNDEHKYYADITIGAAQGRHKDFACVQLHHTFGITGEKVSKDGKKIRLDEAELGFQGSLERRSVFYHASANDLHEEIEKVSERRAEAQYLNDKTLYPYEDYKENIYGQGHHWGMSVDLAACTGCGACTIACMAENNVPVVGKAEVATVHEMSWIRIDRYYYGDIETPNVAYMPMMCQHCDNAPCENVCPVAATNHSSEGLNQMTYNRCIGTRYCANNCPFKVRRFNWLDYTSADLFAWNEVDMNFGKEGAESYNYMTDKLTRMVLNPDVTVRSRGVIEKCSFCVQRIQEGKLTAKVEGRRLRDGDVKTACQTACPTGAIIFGDQNDKNSELNKRWADDRNYFALEETNVKSSVGYMIKVTNKEDKFLS